MKDKAMAFWTTPPNFMLVATCQENVVGLVAIQQRENKIAELNRLSVSLQCRGLGIGKSLVHSAIVESKKFGFESVTLTTGMVRKEAVRVYEKLGFILKRQFEGKINLFLPIPGMFHGIIIKKFTYKIHD
jgi:ribosomal protein S18 acetylase RimI-like enzyme